MAWHGRGDVEGQRPLTGRSRNEGSVLVVADDFATRQSLIAVLASSDIEAIGAGASDALELEAQYQPTVALVEHSLTSTDGLVLAARLKERQPDMPVLLLTDPQALGSAQPSAYVDQYLVKPLASAAFVQTVRNAFNQRALAEQNNRLASRLGQPFDTEPTSQVRPPAVPAGEEPGILTTPWTESDRWDEPGTFGRPLGVPSAREEIPQPPAEPAAADQLGDEAASFASGSVFGQSFEPGESLAVTPAEAPLDLLRDVPVDDRLRRALTVVPERRAAAIFLVGPHYPPSFDPRRDSEVLRAVESQLAVARRRTDTVVAAGSGRFVVVCTDVDVPATAEVIASGIVREISRPISVAGAQLRLGASIGVVLTENTGDDSEHAPEELLEDALLALQISIDEGRPWVVFDDAVGDGVRLRERLRRAMDNGELRLDFQRVVNLETHQVVGAEALLRWQRPGRGLLSASDFLDKARESGMAVTIGHWVLDHALSELTSWRARGLLAERFRLFVNVSAEEIVDREFADTVEKLLRDHGVPPAMLSLEMPESAIGDAAADTHAVQGLRVLADLGVACLVDDFGTGRPNLDWLQDLPVTGLKISPELVAALDRQTDRRGPAIVRAVIAFGHELQMMVVGEGVESVAQQVALRAMGCDLAQGYHVGRPEPSDVLAGSLAG